MRRHLAGDGILVPAQPRLVVEVDAQHVGTRPIVHRPGGDAAGAAAGDVGVRPIALAAEIHLVAAAHRAAGDEVAARPQEIGFLVLGVGAVDQVEAQPIFALGELLGPLGPGPIDQAVTAAAEMAVDLDGRGRGGPVGRRFERVMPRPQEPAVKVQVLGRPGVLALDRHRRGSERKRQLAAFIPQHAKHEAARRKGRRRGADHGDVDPLVGLVGRAGQRQQDLQLRRRQSRRESQQGQGCQYLAEIRSIAQAFGTHGVAPGAWSVFVAFTLSETGERPHCRPRD